MSVEADAATAFGCFLQGSTPPVPDIARALRSAVIDRMPGAVEWFDPGNGLLAIGTGRSMRELVFAIIPHSSHVNLQLADGADLPNHDGRIEGTGKRIRHVKARSLEDISSTWMRRAIDAQVAYRANP